MCVEAAIALSNLMSRSQAARGALKRFNWNILQGCISILNQNAKVEQFLHSLSRVLVLLRGSLTVKQSLDLADILVEQLIQL